jgi:O-antigen/teichoic acid export membrane protein
VEAWVTVAECAIAVVVALALSVVMSAVAAALAALVIARGLGAAARRKRLPDGGTDHLEGPSAARRQAPFVLTTGAIVLQGQADVLVIGAVGSFVFLGVYGPLLRIVYGVLLVAEAVSWGLMALPVERWDERRHPALRWHWLVLAVGLLLGGVVFALARPVLAALLGASSGVSSAALAFLALVVPIRFFAFAQSVRLVRSGRQARRVPVLVVGTAVLALGAGFGAAQASFLVLALARLASETVIALGYTIAGRPDRVPVPTNLELA